MWNSTKDNVQNEDQEKNTFEQKTANEKKESFMKMMTPKVMVIAQPTTTLLDFNSVSSMNYNAKVKLCIVLIPTINILWILNCLGLPICHEYDQNIAMVNQTNNCSRAEVPVTAMSCSEMVDSIINVYIIVTIFQVLADVFAAIVETRNHIMLWMMLTVGTVSLNVSVIIGYFCAAHYFGFRGDSIFFWTLAFLDLMSMGIRLNFLLKVRVLFKKMKSKCQLKKSKGVMVIPIPSNIGDHEYFMEYDMESFK